MADLRLKPVEAALAARDARRAHEALDAAMKAGARPPALLFANVASALLGETAFQRGEAWARRGLDMHPRSAELWLTLGSALRRSRRLDEAVQALTRARGLAPGQPNIRFNLANIHNDRGDGAAAQAELVPLIQAKPADAELRRMLARALRHQGDLDGADAALAEAIRLAPRQIDAWCDRAMLASERQRHDAAIEILAQAAAQFPDDPRIIGRQADVLVRAGRLDAACAALEAEVAARPDAPWPRHHLARLLLETDVPTALAHAEAAAALAPNDAATAVTLAQALHRSAQSGNPGRLQDAYELAKALAEQGPPPAEHAFTIRSILAQAADVDGVTAVGDFAALGRYWALNGHHGAFLSQIPLADTPERRRELLDQHRLWAIPIERRAAATPALAPGRAPGARLRVGFLSSDLRRHPVGYFAQGLFEHYDPDRFELYVYSFFPHEADAVQARLASQATAYRSLVGLSEQQTAQAIADDGLDILIELGGTTRYNFVQVLAYRPAPLQASWLGYPHSVGLSAIDHLILDRHAAPSADDLLVERPLLMPSTWIVLNPGAFRDEPAVRPRAPDAPFTFGTANHPTKYTRAALEVWAGVVAATPGSRFLFLRPEAAAPAFRANVSRIFAEAGVDPGRIDFEPVVGRHLEHYGRMDVSLDTFPLTGGATTCESLWMGVPVVSLRGEALYQRLSHSILTNAGLGEFSVERVKDFVALATALAGDPERVAALRARLRDQLKAGPLGDAAAFTRDFFTLVTGAVEARRERRTT